MPRRHISATERSEIFARFDGVCHICGQKIDGGREAWEVEHVIPIEMGGSDKRGSDNLQPAHKSCHAEKTAEDMGHIAKGKRMRQRDIGIRRQPRSKLPGGKSDKWKRALTSEGPKTVRR